MAKIEKEKDKSKIKRNRLHASCIACFRSKRKCSRKQPCENCVLREIPCEYTNQRTMKKSTNVKTPQNINEFGNTKVPGIVQCDSTDGSEPSSELPNSGGDDDDKYPATDPPPAPAGSTANVKSKSQVIEFGDRFYIQQGIGYQKSTLRYFGPSSGPSFLLFREPTRLPKAPTERFPKYSIPGLDEILASYKAHFHWVVACLEWNVIEELLDTANITEVNNLLYLILALGCLGLGRCTDAKEFYDRSKTTANVTCLADNAENTTKMLYYLYEIFYLECLGEHEATWNAIVSAIGKAVSMGYHRDCSSNSTKVYDNFGAVNLSPRIWHTLLESHYKLCMVTGRPPFVTREMTNVPLPFPTLENFSHFSYRDSLNLLGPIYCDLLRATLQTGGSSNGTNNSNNTMLLVKLSETLSGWWARIAHLYSVKTGIPLDPDKSYECSHMGQGMSSLPDTPDSAYKTEEQMYCLQFLCLEMYKLFLETRIHRSLMKDEDNNIKTFAMSKFYSLIRDFAFISNRVHQEDSIYILPDIMSFLVDNFLYLSVMKYCCDEAVVRSSFIYRKYVDQTLAQMNSTLQMQTRSKNGIKVLMAKKVLAFADAIEHQDHFQMFHPILELSLTEDMKHYLRACGKTNAISSTTSEDSASTIDLSNFDSAKQSPGLADSFFEPSHASYDLAAALNFDIQDWTQWTPTLFGS